MLGDDPGQVPSGISGRTPHPNPLPQGERGPDILRRSAILDRLVTPPCVVVVGRPNVGKSTLTNRMLGRAASIVADLPGTTRDWVAGLAEIHGIAVRWLDTPGIRASDDSIEQRAIELAADAIRGVDVVITMRDAEIDWPEAASLPRMPDIRVMNKIDQSQQSVIDSEVIPISAATGDGVVRLEKSVMESLGLSAVTTPVLWAFSRELKGIIAASDWAALKQYVGV